MKRIQSAMISAALLLAFGIGLTAEAAAQEKVQARTKIQQKVQAKVQAKAQTGPLFVDADGDGICDNLGARLGQGKGRMNAMHGKHYGPGDGTGNQGIRPMDGTGFGPGNGQGTGVCDGTGPKGRGGRK